MKIAFMGNMNNNNFALLRYFRDLGFDAHLLLFKNDGKGHSYHFAVESDTFEIEKWKPYIHQTNISDDICCAFNFPFSWLLSFRSYIRSIFKKNLTYAPPVSKKYLKNLLQKYNVIIGSGITPTVLERVNCTLDIFYPYAIGVEYVGDQVIYSKSKKNFLYNLIFQNIKKKQIKALQKVNIIINSDRSFTEKILNKFSLKSLPIFIPFIYNKETNDNELDYQKVYNKIEKSNFSVISCSRHIWKKPKPISDIDWINQNKNNDRFIKAFAEICQKFPIKKPLLITFEYGPDVHNTKELVKSLNIKENVLWLPITERKYLLNLISKCDVGIGEFYDIKNLTWGATAMEVMAMGKPVIQAYDYQDNEFLNHFGISPPPIVSARTEKEIFDKLSYLLNFSEKRYEISKKSKEWFNKNMGIELAKKWTSLLKN